MERPLRRPRRGRWIGGVCAGVAERFGWPVWAVRVVWTVVAAIPVLPGLPAYLVVWLLVPAEGSGAADRRGDSMPEAQSSDGPDQRAQE